MSLISGILPVSVAYYKILIYKNTFAIIEIMKTLIKVGADQETPSIFWLGPQLTIIVNKPNDMKDVLTSPNCLQKPYVYDFIGGISIFNSPGNITAVIYED